MKLKLKKILFLLNDLSALFLAKEISREREVIGRLRKYLIIGSVLLAISLVLNIILFFLYY